MNQISCSMTARYAHPRSRRLPAALGQAGEQALLIFADGLMVAHEKNSLTSH
jgi:hypothetical protein